MTSPSWPVRTGPEAGLELVGNRAEEGQRGGPTFVPASCPKTDPVSGGTCRTRPLGRPVSPVEGARFLKGQIIRDKAPDPTTSSSVPETSTQTVEAGISIMAPGLWDAKSQTEESFGARSACFGQRVSVNRSSRPIPPMFVQTMS